MMIIIKFEKSKTYLAGPWRWLLQFLWPHWWEGDVVLWRRAGAGYHLSSRPSNRCQRLDTGH